MPELHKALMDAHLANARERADEMREELDRQFGGLLRRMSDAQADLLMDAYAQGVRDGYVQGVGAATKDAAS